MRFSIQDLALEQPLQKVRDKKNNNFFLSQHCTLKPIPAASRVSVVIAGDTEKMCSLYSRVPVPRHPG
jgi:hypothetical protein